MKKPMLLVTLVLLICSFGLFAGGGQSRQPSTAGTGGPAKLTVAMAENLRIQDFKTNGMTRMIERGANVDMEFVMLPSSDYSQRINLMAMAGGQDLPDVLMASAFSDSLVYSWGQTGAIIPLTKYYKDMNASVNIQAGIKRGGIDILRYITFPNGEIYCVPRYHQDSGSEHQPKAWYLKSWLDKLGLQEPTTTEEFRSVLRAVVNGDPNGNGIRDEIGITGTFNITAPESTMNWFQFLMNAFIYSGDSNFLQVNNGRVSAAYTHPEWREGLKYMRSLFAEGLMPIENITQDLNQARMLINADPHRVFMYPHASVVTHINANNPIRDEFMFLAPLKGPKGVQYTGYRPTILFQSMLITSNCKDPDSAFRMGDYMWRPEFAIITRYGEEGVQWDYPQNVRSIEDYIPMIPGSPISIVLYDDSSFWGGTGVTNCSWRQVGPYFYEYSLSDGRGYKKDTPISELLQGPARSAYYDPAYQPKEVIPKLIYTEEELNDIGEISATLRSYIIESTSNFLAGNRDIDSTWNAYINDINNIGLGRFLSTVQKVYDRMWK